MRHEVIRLGDTGATLTTYLPENKDKNADAILVIPGGAYRMVCADREGEPIAMDFAVRGMRAFVLDYTVKAGAKYPAPEIQASMAMAHIRRNAAEYGLNPERVFVVGFSAGGHLAGAMATMWHREEIYKAAGVSYGENRPTGAMLCYPVLAYFDRTNKETFFNQAGTTEPDEALLKHISVVESVDEKTVPCFLWHTADDKVVNVGNSLRMMEKLSENGIFYEAHIYPHGPHGMALANKVTGGVETMRDESIAGWTALAYDWTKKIQ